VLLAAVGAGIGSFAVVQLVLGGGELQTVWDLVRSRLGRSRGSAGG